MMGPWGMIKKPDEMIIPTFTNAPQSNNAPPDMGRRGQAITLDMCEPNFRWPSKIQALVYRIFNYKKEREIKRNDPDWWKQDFSEFSRSRDRIEAWCGTLFGTDAAAKLFGPVLNWRLDFDAWRFDPNIHSYITLMLETRNDLINIKIFTGRSLYDCIDIHSHAFNWRMGGANIFDIKYEDESVFISKFGERKQYDIVVKGFDLKMDPGFAGQYHGVLQSYAKDDEAKKKQREFKELQDKIANMASVAKDI